MALREPLLALHSGEASFDDFARATRRDWHALALYLVAKWNVPPAVSVEDVEQELLTACWMCVGEYDEGRGVPIERFCVFNATDKAKKWIHKQRDALRRRDNTPSRIPVSIHTLDPDNEFLIGQWGDQEDSAARSVLLDRALCDCSTDRDMLCVVALYHAGSFVGAARMLYDNADIRRYCRFDSVECAQRTVRRAAHRAARRAAQRAELIAA